MTSHPRSLRYQESPELESWPLPCLLPLFLSGHQTQPPSSLPPCSWAQPAAEGKLLSERFNLLLSPWTPVFLPTTPSIIFKAEPQKYPILSPVADCLRPASSHLLSVRPTSVSELSPCRRCWAGLWAEVPNDLRKSFNLLGGSDKDGSCLSGSTRQLSDPHFCPQPPGHTNAWCSDLLIVPPLHSS